MINNLSVGVRPLNQREATILDITKTLERRSGRVFPWMIEPWLNDDMYMSERTIRRYMSKMANQGLLKRHGVRQGYGLQEFGKQRKTLH